MRKELKQIKNIMKKNNVWKLYKQSINNWKFRLIISKIFLIFQKMDFKELAQIEESLYKNLNEDFFIRTFNKIKIDADWTNFGKFIFLIYKTSNYKYDLKNKNENIFIQDPIYGNAIKRNYYDKWLQSLDFSKSITNINVQKILKLVFKWKWN